MKHQGYMHNEFYAAGPYFALEGSFVCGALALHAPFGDRLQFDVAKQDILNE